MADFEYHFGVPGELIWTFHIIFGAFLVYIGYELSNKRRLPEFVPALLLTMGAMSLLYHGHIWLFGDN